MVSALLVINILIAVALFSLGLLVLFKNGNLITNKLFAFFDFSLGLWLISNYYSNDFTLTSAVALWVNHFVLFFSGVALLCIFWFSVLIASNTFFQKRKYIFFILLGFVAASLSPPAIESITRQGEVYAIEFGLLAGFYFLALAFCAIATFAVLGVGARKSSGAQKIKIQVFIWSMVATVAVTMLTNFVLPVVFGSFELTNMGPISTLFMVAGLYYGVIKHKLFDIRLIVARSIAYLLLLSSLVGLYGVIVFGLTDRIFQFSDSAQRLTPIFTAILLVFTSPYLRRHFDKLTNRLFYRDAYDAQTFLDQLNKVLVSSVDLEALLNKCASIIDTNLKSEYCLFGLKETAYSEQRVIGTSDKTFHKDDVAKVRAMTPHMQQNIFVSDEIEENSDLKKAMQKYDVAILGRLAADGISESEGLGYMILGAKKSGNPYNKQDMRIITIILNELVIAIQNALRYEEIEKFAITLQEKVDSATKELQRTNEKLKQIDETKDEFISMASHQLRTPLTSVKGYLSMVLEGDVGEVNEKQNKMLEQAFLSSQRMVYLIADLLNVSRLKTGKFVIDPKETDLAQVVETEVEQLRPTAKLRDLKLSFKKPKNFPSTVMIDETKIRQVIMNFIDNAIYYTPAGGKIEVSLVDTGKAIEYTVKDSGMGVPKSERHNLFSKFFRAGNARKARPDGTGLGLFMAKKVVVAQGGAIIFETEENKGSTFGFTFAKEKLEKIAADHKKEIQKI